LLWAISFWKPSMARCTALFSFSLSVTCKYIRQVNQRPLPFYRERERERGRERERERETQFREHGRTPRTRLSLFIFPNRTKLLRELTFLCAPRSSASTLTHSCETLSCRCCCGAPSSCTISKFQPDGIAFHNLRMSTCSSMTW
jgi:hypothetical protein